MNIDTLSNTALLSGCVGALLGSLITKIFDLISMNKQHKLNVKREFFIKKIDAFEKTVSYLTLVQSSVKSLTLNFNTLLDDKVYYDDNTNSRYLEAIETNFKDISSKTQDIASSIRLYYDFPLEYIKSQKLDDFYLTMGEISLEAEKLRIIGEQNQNQKINQGNTTFDKQVRNSLNQVQEKISKLNAISNEITNYYDSLIGELRREVKKYE